MTGSEEAHLIDNSVAHAYTDVVAITLAVEKNFPVELEGHIADLQHYGDYNDETAAEALAALRRQTSHIHEPTNQQALNFNKLPLTEVIDIQNGCLAVSRKLFSLTNVVAKELTPNDTNSIERDSLTHRLVTTARNPFETMLRWSTVGHTILAGVTKISVPGALRLCSYLDPADQKAISNDLKEALQTPSGEWENLPGWRIVADLLQTSSYVRSRMPAGISDRIVELEQNWRTTTRLGRGATKKTITAITLYNIPEVKATVQSRLRPDTRPVFSEEHIRTARETITEAIATHTADVAPYRPTWSSLKTTLKPFANALLKECRQEENPLPLPEDSVKRLTGVLRTMETLGATKSPEMLFKDLRQLFVEEYATRFRIEDALDVLETAHAKPDLSDWHFVMDDLALISTHWERIKPIMGETWAPIKGTIDDAIAAVELVKEQCGLAHQRAHGDVMKREIKEGAAKPHVAENIRNSASVITHFVELADSQQSFQASMVSDTLLYSLEMPWDERYYCVVFKDTRGKEWALFETLGDKEASFVIPTSIINEYGTIREFVEVFDDDMQHEFEPYAVLHGTDWTAASHIARIEEKMATE